MSKLPENQDNFDAMSDYEVDEIEYEEMELLERLETLREEMEDLGVTTLAEVNQRIEELHRRLDIQNE
jgi:ribosomal protein S18